MSQSLWWIGGPLQATKQITSFTHSGVEFLLSNLLKICIMGLIHGLFSMEGGLCFGVLFFSLLFSPSIGVFLSAFSIICVDLMIFPRSSQIFVCANMLRNYLRILCCTRYFIYFLVLLQPVC